MKGFSKRKICLKYQPKAAKQLVESPTSFLSTKQWQNSHSKWGKYFCFCGGSEKSRFNGSSKSRFKIFLAFFVWGRIDYFFDKVLTLLGCRSRYCKWSMNGFKKPIFGMITVSLDVRIVNIFVFTPIWVWTKLKLSGIVYLFRALQNVIRWVQDFKNEISKFFSKFFFYFSSAIAPDSLQCVLK